MLYLSVEAVAPGLTVARCLVCVAETAPASSVPASSHIVHSPHETFSGCPHPVELIRPPRQADVYPTVVAAHSVVALRPQPTASFPIGGDGFRLTPFLFGLER